MLFEILPFYLSSFAADPSALAHQTTIQAGYIPNTFKDFFNSENILKNLGIKYFFLLEKCLKLAKIRKNRWSRKIDSNFERQTFHKVNY